MNRLALGWVDTALALEQERDELQRENEALRTTLVDLLKAYQQAAADRSYRFALLTYANHLIAERFPTEDELEATAVASSYEDVGRKEAA